MEIGKYMNHNYSVGQISFRETGVNQLALLLFDSVCCGNLVT